MKTHIDVPALYAALDSTRRAQDLSWRSLARNLDLSPSLFSRLANGFKPDTDSFVTLLNYLRVDAASFFTGSDSASRHVSAEPELIAQLAPLLRARKDLSDADVEYLEAIISATLRRSRAERGE